MNREEPIGVADVEKFFRLLGLIENHDHFSYNGFVCPKCGWSSPSDANHEVAKV